MSVKGIFKVLIAGLASVAILSVLLCLYSLTPVHINNPIQNTDYVWAPNSIWVKVTEGIACGRFDSNGYNNAAVVDDPDIIVLGSSHMEATHVMQDENCAALLSEKLDGSYSVYNMGISGNNFYKVCQYLPTNLSLYTPKLAILETSTVQLSQEGIENILSGSVAVSQSHSTGIIGIMQRIPFFRCLYQQIDGGLLGLFMPSSETNVSDINDGIETAVEEVDLDAYRELFSYLQSMEETYGTQLIIVYHPTESLTESGDIHFDRDEYLKAFSSCADEYGITFVDMTDSFETMYNNEHHVAHGFCTGELATGHLNKYGHAAIANELYEVILDMEEAE